MAYSGIMLINNLLTKFELNCCELMRDRRGRFTGQCCIFAKKGQMTAQLQYKRFTKVQIEK